MNIEQLKDKVQQATERVEKRKQTIERHQKALAKKLAALQKLNPEVTLDNMWTFKWDANGRGSDLYWPICEVEGKLDDIKGATKNLQEAEDVLQNWQQKLDLATEKERFLSDNAPQVIIDFLNQWKALAYEWHIRTYARYVALKEELNVAQHDAMIEAAETLPVFKEYLDPDGKLPEHQKTEFALINLRPRQAMDEFLEQRKLRKKDIDERLGAFGGAILYMATFSDEKRRLEWLERTLEAERKDKMLDLINRVNAVVGSIEDASGLDINAKGNLDGIIVGTKANARVETIGAGGWNIQVFHYRTLVHEIK